MDKRPSQRDLRAAAAVLRGVLDEVQAGRLDADGSYAAGLRSRIEGAVVAIDAAAGSLPEHPVDNAAPTSP